MNSLRARGARDFRLAAIAALAACLIAPAACAQAWLPPKGDVQVSLDYSRTLNKKHYDSQGVQGDFGHTDVEVLNAGISYSPANRWLVRAGLPLVRTRYRGTFPHPGDIDSGEWHSKVTDFQLSVHYQLIDGPFALSPYVGIVLPTQDYTTLGHAAPGRGLDEYWVGFYVAQSLNEWIPRTYVQGRYNYAFVEKVAGVPHDRSNADLELGYFFNPNWSGRVLASWQDTYDGVDLPVPPTDPLFPHHDQLGAEDYFTAGVGLAWAASDRMNVHFLAIRMFDGKNAHKVDHRFSLGMSYSVGDR